MPRSPTITAHLAHWDDIKNCPKSSGILLGNGFSRTLWEPFDYPSLFHSAKTLTGEDNGGRNRFRPFWLSPFSRGIGKPSFTVCIGRYKCSLQACSLSLGMGPD